MIAKQKLNTISFFLTGVWIALNFFTSSIPLTISIGIALVAISLITSFSNSQNLYAGKEKKKSVFDRLRIAGLVIAATIIYSLFFLKL